MKLMERSTADSMIDSQKIRLLVLFWAIPGVRSKVWSTRRAPTPSVAHLTAADVLLMHREDLKLLRDAACRLVHGFEELCVGYSDQSSAFLDV